MSLNNTDDEAPNLCKHSCDDKWTSDHFPA